jgi:hypothetical protein
MKVQLWYSRIIPLYDSFVAIAPKSSITITLEAFTNAEQLFSPINKPQQSQWNLPLGRILFVTLAIETE